jgi:uncharacterized membrane protein
VNSERKARLFEAGRIAYALAIFLFGVQYFVYAKLAGGLPPWQAWTPSATPLAYLLGFVFIATAVFLLVPRWAQRTALAFGILLCVVVVVADATHVSDVVVHAIARTRALEPLAIAGGAFILAGMLGGDEPWVRGIYAIGRYLLAVCLCIFGVQHFMIAEPIASLLPAWMPGHVAVVYLTGSGFIAAGIAIGANVLSNLAAKLLALQMVLFIVLLHIPLAVTAWSNADLWTSAYVPLALLGIALVVAAAPPAKKAIAPLTL